MVDLKLYRQVIEIKGNPLPDIDETQAKVNRHFLIIFFQNVQLETDLINY